MKHPAPLPRDFYDFPAPIVARALLGKILHRETADGITAGKIVETEAYLSSRDPACHANRGMTRKNASMFGPPGHAYVYMIHSRWCLNAVTEPVGMASAVLIRAIEPTIGREIMQVRRGPTAPLDIARGPGRLCQAMAVTKLQDGWDLTLGRELWIAEDPDQGRMRIIRSPRVGITAATHRLLRFFIADNPHVSRKRTY